MRMQECQRTRKRDSPVWVEVIGNPVVNRLQRGGGEKGADELADNRVAIRSRSILAPGSAWTAVQDDGHR